MVAVLRGSVAPWPYPLHLSTGARPLYLLYLRWYSPCCYTYHGYTILTTSTKVLSLLLVTHDRSFLERTCGEILELDNAAVYSYQVHLL